MIVRVLVHDLRGKEEIVDLCDTEEQLKSITVLQLKEKILEKIPEAHRCFCENREELRLIFRDHLLEDSSLLTEYGIRHMSVIHMVVKVPGGGWCPGKGDGGMGDKEGKNLSMEKLSDL